MTVDYRIAIIGAGLAGLGLGMRLRGLGEDSFVILERAQSIGGTWRDNVYPGCACDAPSHFYWYSFDTPPDWSRKYAAQPEILAKIEDAARRYDIERFVQCNSEVVELRWNDDAQYWTIILSDGRRVAAQCVIGATGQLSKPSFAGIPGREIFQGPLFHSSQWPRDLDLRGKRVIVIGGGASAAQIIPEVAKDAARLTVIQRTAPYVYPRDDRAYTPEERLAFQTDPDIRAASRQEIFEFFEAIAEAVKPGSDAAIGAELLWRQHMEAQISDPALREKLTPNYTLGCKRALICDDYYPTFERDNVTLLTIAVAEVTPTGVRTADGMQVDADVVVFATGFQALEFLPGIDVQGPKGALRQTLWQDGARAYLGMTAPGFPNLFLTFGPNTNITSSIIAMIEAQHEYILQAMEHMAARQLASIDVTDEAFLRFDRETQEKLSRSTYATGCHSWFINESGRIVTNWPGNVRSYQDATARFNPLDYHQRAPSARRSGPPA